MTEAYPLQWPHGRPRTKATKRASFNKKDSRGWAQSLTVADALDRLQREVDLLGARQYVLSSNLQTRLDGRPRSGQAEPTDRGVALYFHIGDKPHCLPCDRYDRVADNIAAVAKHIEATRAIERYGVANMAEMFAGFMALPAPGAKRSWREVFGYAPQQTPSRTSLEAAFRQAAKKAHPDTGGSPEAMAELNQARDEAMKEVGA